MCHSVVTRDGRAETCGELAALLGIPLYALPRPKGVDRLEPQWCLCSISLRQAAEMAGLVIFSPAYDDGDLWEHGMVPESEVRALLLVEDRP